MCIALLSTAHPAYKLILIDNRDEYLNRPTATAEWWPEPHQNVLGGRDLLRAEQGTWLGMTRTGKIAVLTNFREENPPPVSAISRGAMIKDFLTDDSTQTTREYVSDMVKGRKTGNVGGFSLVCGRIGERLAVVSNRSTQEAEVPWIVGDTVMTVGLSNAAFGDSGWRKVEEGESKMLNTLRESVAKDEDENLLLQRLLALLSTDTLPRSPINGGGLETYIGELRNTILVPALGHKDISAKSADDVAAAKTKEKAEIISKGVGYRPHLGVSGLYGTQKQTVVLVDHSGRARFFERTLFDEKSDPVPIGRGDVDINFQIEASQVT